MGFFSWDVHFAFLFFGYIEMRAIFLPFFLSFGCFGFGLDVFLFFLGRQRGGKKGRRVE